MQEPPGTLLVEGKDACSPAHPDMVDEPTLPIEVDDSERASRIPLDARWERVGLVIPHDPHCSLFPKEPDGGDAGTILGCRGQVSEQRTREELIQIDGSGSVSDDPHALVFLFGPLGVDVPMTFVAARVFGYAAATLRELAPGTSPGLTAHAVAGKVTR